MLAPQPWSELNVFPGHGQSLAVGALLLEDRRAHVDVAALLSTVVPLHFVLRRAERSGP
ncbi:MAG: hypothetical protein ACYCZ6_05095 [Polaromonas sp.]